MMIGVVTGLASGMLGIGGGIVMTTLLSSWPNREMPQHEAVSTSLVAMVPTGLAATAMNAYQGNVQYKAGSVLALSSSIAMYSAAKYLAPYIEEQNMRNIFAAVLTLSALRMAL